MSLWWTRTESAGHRAEPADRPPGARRRSVGSSACPLAEPTILATSGGTAPAAGPWCRSTPSCTTPSSCPAPHGRRPRAHVRRYGHRGRRALRPPAMDEAARVAGFDLTPLHLFPMPNLEDVEGTVLDQDVVWVIGGSVANLLAVWRVHGLDADPAPGLGGRRGAQRGQRRLDLLVHAAAPPTPSAPNCGRSPTRWASCRTATACTTTARRGAGRWCTGWSPTARCRPPTARTTGSGWSTAAPSSSRPSRSWPGRAPTSSPRRRHGGRRGARSNRAGCPRRPP